MTLYEKMVYEKQIVLEDICDIKSLIKELMNYERTLINGIPIGRGFPFGNDFISIYEYKLKTQFDLDKESIMELSNKSYWASFDNEQIFETEVTLFGDIGYIRYLFPVAFAESLIEQAGIEAVLVDVEVLYEYSKNIEIDSNYAVENEKPIIVLDYPYSAPGFFVLDGNHRVTQAYENQKEKYEAFILGEAVIPLIAPQRIFALLAIMHRNLNLIVLYYLERIEFEDLKKGYQNIGDEKWL